MTILNADWPSVVVSKQQTHPMGFGIIIFIIIIFVSLSILQHRLAFPKNIRKPWLGENCPNELEKAKTPFVKNAKKRSLIVRGRTNFPFAAIASAPCVQIVAASNDVMRMSVALKNPSVPLRFAKHVSNIAVTVRNPVFTRNVSWST
jgi:hypothetical protein